MNMNRTFLAACGLALAVFAGWFMAIEFRAIHQRGAGSEAYFARIAISPPAGFARAQSLSGQRKQLTDCINRQNSYLWARAQPQTRLSLTAACRDLADQVLKGSPSRGLAHAVRADVLWRLGQTDAATEALARAQASASHEGWVAVIRLRTALRLAFGVAAARGADPSVAADSSTVDRLLGLASADLAVLAESSGLAPNLAGVYLAVPPAGDWMIAQMDLQSEAAQRRFLSALRAARNPSGRAGG